VEDDVRARPKKARLARHVAVVMFVCVLLAALGVRTASALTTCSVDDGGCPLAVEDEYWVPFGHTLSVHAAQGLLANDFGPAGTVIDPDYTDTVTWGGAAVTLGQLPGAFTYKPDPLNPFSGDDTFTYGIKDRLGDTDLNTVTIHVVASVSNDVYYTKVDQPLDASAPGVLSNDNAIPSAYATYVSVQNGDVALNDDGSFSYTPPAGFSGVDSFDYSVDDTDGTNTYTATVTIHVDSTPPTVSVSAPGPVTLSTPVPVAWTATDVGGSGVASQDVLERGAPWNAGFAPAVTWKSATIANAATFSGTYGRTYCFTARARDFAGNVSGWSAARCTSVPLRAANLAYSSGWGTVSSSLYFAGSAHKTKTHGSRVTRSSIQAKRIWLVATKCSSCGTAQVQWNGVVTANVNLASATTKHEQLIAVASFSSARTGTLTITTTSASGKLLIVEGLAISRI
jgi:Bacterial Ig domain